MFKLTIFLAEGLTVIAAGSLVSVVVSAVIGGVFLVVNGVLTALIVQHIQRREAPPDKDRVADGD